MSTLFPAIIFEFGEEGYWLMLTFRSPLAKISVKVYVSEGGVPLPVDVLRYNPSETTYEVCS